MIQSKVYQKNYQSALKKQVGGILDKMHEAEFKTVSEYIEQCYENGFVGTLYDLQGQGIPLAFPMDQEAMVRAVQLDSKISEGLYTRLGEDVSMLKRKITAQVSRGISTGMSYQQVAQQLANVSRIGYNNAIRISRTEGHRVQCQSSMDACYKAKEKGAEVVKKWDATLDARTRESHVMVDGEIRELDEKFSNGLMFPGDPAGGAAEVINCRCALDQSARWALEGSFTKYDGFSKELKTFEDADAYNEFKKAYFSKENRQYMNYVGKMENKYKTKNFNKILDSMDDDEYKRFTKLQEARPMFNGMYRGDDFVKRTKSILETPGMIGEKAIPYSKRGIELPSNITQYINGLKKNGDYISREAGAFKYQDLAILTTETGVEYTSLTIGIKSFLIRGLERSTTIPQDLHDALIKNQGTLDCHSHPFIGDLIPSESDKNLLKLLTWQKESVIIDPTQNAVRFTVDGTVEMFNVESDHEDSYWATLFGGGDSDA